LVSIFANLANRKLSHDLSTGKNTPFSQKALAKEIIFALIFFSPNPAVISNVLTKPPIPIPCIMLTQPNKFDCLKNGASPAARSTSPLVPFSAP